MPRGQIWGHLHGLVLSCIPYDCLVYNQGCEIFAGPMGLLKIHRWLKDWGSLGLVNGFNFTRAHKNTDTQPHTHTHCRSKSCYDHYIDKSMKIAFLSNYSIKIYVIADICRRRLMTTESLLVTMSQIAIRWYIPMYIVCILISWLHATELLTVHKH